MNLIEELKRRNVFRVALCYLVSAWLLLQAGDLLFDLLGLPDWTLRLVLGILILGFPVAVIFSWVYELTPEGLRRESDLDRHRSSTPPTGRKLELTTLVAAVLAISLIAAQNSGWVSKQPETASASTLSVAESSAPPAPPDISQPVIHDANSIAVLPFADMSEEYNQAYFVDGLAEEILNALARTPDLLVASRTSSFQYRDSSEDVRDIASAIGVAHILEGSVRRSEKRIRVTAQLIRASDGYHVWSETYDRLPDDVIEIQEDVATEIAIALNTAMDPDALQTMIKIGTSSVSAYVAYLEGRARLTRALETGSEDIYQSAQGYFQSAIDQDPGFAAAYGGLAEFWDYQLLISYFWGTAVNPTLEILPNFRKAITTAIRHEADSIRRTAYMAHQANREFRIRDGLALNTQLLAARPNDPRARELQVFFYLYLGDKEAMLATGQEAINLGIYPSGFAAEFIRALVFGGATESLADVIELSLERFPAHAEVVYQSHRGLLWLKQVARADQLMPFITSSDLGPETKFLAKLRQACGEGRVSDARQLADSYSASANPSTNILWLARRIMGDDQHNQHIQQYDDNKDMLSMWSFYEYGIFDARPFPNLMALLQEQEIEPHKVEDLPYACPADE